MKRFLLALALFSFVGASFGATVSEKIASFPTEKLQIIEKALIGLQKKTSLDARKKAAIAQLLPLIVREIQRRSTASQPARDTDTVRVHYVGRLDDGSVFDSSRTDGREPLEFVLGEGMMISGFESAVRGMRVGDKKTFRIAPEEAYGPAYNEEIVPVSEFEESSTQDVPVSYLIGDTTQVFPRDVLSDTFDVISVGKEVVIGELKARIMSISGDDVTVRMRDPSAPFYGKKLTVGLKAVFPDGGEGKITALNGDMATIEFRPNFEIVARTQSHVIIRMKNPHPLAGKALSFSVEILDIIPYEAPTFSLDKKSLQSVLNNAHIQGNAQAQIVWIEYSDLECPFCKRLHDSGTITNIQKKYGDKLAFVFKHYPLPFHSHAVSAARVAECVAREKGVTGYYDFIARIFTAGVPTQSVLVEVGSTFGLTESAVNACIKDSDYEAQDKIDSDMNEGATLFEVNGTPGNVLINTVTGTYEVVSGAQPEENFNAAIERLLAQ